MSRSPETRFRLRPDGSEPRALEEPQALPLPMMRYLANATVALPRMLPLVPLRLLIGLLSPDSLLFLATVAAVATAADAYDLLRPAVATLEAETAATAGPIAAGVMLALLLATLLRGLLETLCTDLLRDRLVGGSEPPVAPFTARWATHTGLALVQLSVFAGTLTAFAPVFAMSVQRMQSGGDDLKVRQLTAAALSILLVVQALARFLVGQGRALAAWRQTFFPALVAQMFSSPWREFRIYGKLLLWLIVGRPLFAQAGAVLLFFAVRLWATADPARGAAAWAIVLLLAVGGLLLSLWVDLLLLGLSGHLRGHLVWAHPRLVRASAGGGEPLFAPPQVGWFIPEPGTQELHRFGYDQILLRPPARTQPAAVAPAREAPAPEVAAVEVAPTDAPSPQRFSDLALSAAVHRAPSGVREQRWEPVTGR